RGARPRGGPPARPPVPPGPPRSWGPAPAASKSRHSGRIRPDDERLSPGRPNRLDGLLGPVRERHDATAPASARELRAVARLPGGLDESVEHRMTDAELREQGMVPVHQPSGRAE